MGGKSDMSENSRTITRSSKIHFKETKRPINEDYAAILCYNADARPNRGLCFHKLHVKLCPLWVPLKLQGLNHTITYRTVSTLMPCLYCQVFWRFRKAISLQIPPFSSPELLRVRLTKRPSRSSKTKYTNRRGLYFS